MATLSTVPTYAPPAREVQVVFALAGVGANYVRAWVTDAPPGSALRKKLDDDTQHRAEVYVGEGGTNHPWRNNFDLGGKYTVVAQEYARGASDYGGGYKGSPASAPSEYKVGAEVTLSLFIGQRLTSTIQVGGDSFELALWVWDGTIRTTSLTVHGEVSPALVATSGTPRAAAVVESVTVRAALSALRDVAAGTAIGSVSAVLSDLVTKRNLHLVEATVHNASDADNEIPVGLAGAASATGLPEAVTEILPLVRYHYTNDATKAGTTSGRDTASYHQVSGQKRNDNANLPIVQGAAGLADGYWAVAELCRSYEGHRVSSAHTNPDTVNVLTARPLIMQLGEIVLGILASTTPTVPPTQSPGAMQLIALGGFTEAPL